MSDTSSLDSYLKRREERRTRLLAADPVEYQGGPVYDEDFDRYYPELGSLVEARWDDGETYEDALVYECRVELAHTPDIAEYIDERWGEEIEDWDGISDALRAKLEALTEEISKEAPTVWYADYKLRLVFDYSGFPEQEMNDNA